MTPELTPILGNLRVSAVASLDTIGFSTRQVLPALRSPLRRQYRDNLIIDDKDNRFGHWTKIEINRPTTQTIKELLRYNLSLNRYDVAWDFPNHLASFLEQNTVLKYRRNQQQSEFETTLYWSKRTARRNLVLYSDRSSKTGLDCPIHLEIRFQKAAACKSRGRSGRKLQLADLLDLDPLQLLTDTTNLRPINYRKLYRKYPAEASQLADLSSQELADRGFGDCLNKLPWSDLLQQVDWFDHGTGEIKTFHCSQQQSHKIDQVHPYSYHRIIDHGLQTIIDADQDV